MLKMQDWVGMLERQKLVDKAIQEKRKVRYVPMHVKKLSLNQEMASFLGEVKADWCYWKDAETVLMAMLEEAADVLHFGATIALQSRKDAELTFEAIQQSYKSNIRMLNSGGKTVDRILSQLSTDPGTFDRIGKMLAYLDHTGVTRDQVVKAHDTKFEKNMARQIAGL